AGRRGRSPVDALAEDGAPIRATGAEVGDRGEGDIDLEAAGQEEDSVDARSEGKVPVVEGAEVALEDPGPPREGGRQVARDREGQVDVGPLILSAGREGAGGGGGDDAVIRLGELEEALPHPVTLRDGEHRPNVVLPRRASPGWERGRT